MEQLTKDIIRRINVIEQSKLKLPETTSDLISPFLALPGLVGFWPMSSVQRSTGNAYDLSGQSRTLTYNGNPTYNYSSLIPYIDLDGTGDFLSRNDETDLDVLGTETIFNSAARGLTIGGWFNLSVVTTSSLIGKWNTTGNQRSYLIGINASNVLTFSVSVDGTATHTATGVGLTASEWYFLVGRFDPSTTNDLFINDAIYSNTTSVPAAVFNSTANFIVGGQNNGGSSLITGKVGPIFLSANFLNNTIIQCLFERTRGAFGV